MAISLRAAARMLKRSPKSLPKHQQLDARFVAVGLDVLPREPVFDQRLDMSVDRGLGRTKDLGHVRDP
ncbi:hypothetical protein LP414_07355 [Polaromonas sp. P1(28)-13]|nr:hypothetical protein LP414_07355 [Polaromonas sp. P1(28)-13]